MATIMPCLWFDGQAEEAARFYASIFPNSRVEEIARCGEHGPGPKGSVLTVKFRLDGQEFLGLNGGPQFRFTEAVSFIVNCETQAEVDRLWARLCEGGAEVQCGWLRDRYGLSWQIVPTVLGRLMSDPDPARAARVMQALLGMTKLDIAALQAAHAGR
jgi:predicted 3-demethylubiquinone-9 3-methyltransferase (glyoxalase superfamily)